MSSGAGPLPAAARAVDETLTALFALKREQQALFENIPHVAEDLPVVCAWYPTVRRVLLWNLDAAPVQCTLRHGRHDRPLALGPLTAELVHTA